MHVGVDTAGGQDELRFDGHSVVMDYTGEVIARAKGFEEDLLVVDLNVEAVARARAAEGRKAGLSRKGANPIDRIVLKGGPTTRRARLVPST